MKACAGKIDSVVELLAGRFDQSVMAHVCRQGAGLFPAAAEITYQCSCPDGRGGHRRPGRRHTAEARRAIADDRLAAVFGIELETGSTPRARRPGRPSRSR